MHVIHLDCSALTGKELSSLCDFLAEKSWITKIQIQPFLLDDLDEPEDEDDEDVMVLNVVITDAHWKSITSDPSDVPELEQAAKSFIDVLLKWGENQRDMIVGYSPTENIILIGNPEDWHET